MKAIALFLIAYGFAFLGECIGQSTFAGSVISNQIAALFLVFAFTVSWVKVHNTQTFSTLPNVRVALHCSILMALLAVSVISFGIAEDYYGLAPIQPESKQIIQQDQWLHQIVGAGVIAPIFEEYAYRGLLLPALIVGFGFAGCLAKNPNNPMGKLLIGISRHRVAFAIAISAIFFGFGHTITLHSILVQGTFGAVQAFTYLATGSLPLVIGLHSLSNLLITAVVYFCASTIDGYSQNDKPLWAMLIGCVNLAIAVAFFVPLFRQYKGNVKSTTFAYTLKPK